MKNNNDFYVYIHYRVSDDTPFYVGKGRKHRCSVRSGRSKWWNNVVDKHGFYYKIIEDGLEESRALELEKETIATLRQQGLVLCNLTDGGDGISGYKHSEEFSLMITKIHTGRKRSPETCERIAEKARGRKASPETTLKLSLIHKAREDNKGIRHHYADKSVHTFQNIETGETFKGTRCCLASYIGVRPTELSGLFNKKKPRRHVHMWRLLVNGTETKTKTEVD